MTGSSILEHDFGHLCFGTRIEISGHSDFGIFNNVGASSILTWVLADTASAACPEHPGSLEKCPWLLRLSIATLMIPAHTAHDPEASFTMSPRRTTRSLYFWNCGSNSEFLRWQRSTNDPCFGNHTIFKKLNKPTQLERACRSPSFPLYISHHIPLLFGHTARPWWEKALLLWQFRKRTSLALWSQRARGAQRLLAIPARIPPFLAEKVHCQVAAQRNEVTELRSNNQITFRQK